MLGVLCIIGRPVQLIREVFSRLHLPSTDICLTLRWLLAFYLTLKCQLMRWFVCPRRLSSKRLLRSAICLHKAYIFHEFAESVFVESSKAFNTLSKILLWIKPSYFSAWFVNVFEKCVWLLVHASMKPGCLARRLLCHKVNLPSCVARQPLCHTK